MQLDSSTNIGKGKLQITVNLDDKLLDIFRETIYYRTGLRRGDFKTAIEDAMLDYILKHTNSDSSSRQFAKNIKKEKKNQN